MLKEKLPGWQEVCCDVSKVPDTVQHMIDGLSSHPEQSLLAQRYNRVCVCFCCVVIHASTEGWKVLAFCA